MKKGIKKFMEGKIFRTREAVKKLGKIGKLKKVKLKKKKFNKNIFIQ